MNMQTTNQPKIRFHGVSIIQVHLNVLRKGEAKQKIDMEVDAKLFPVVPGSKEFRILMSIEIAMPGYWEVKVSGFGDFEFDGSVNESEMQGLIDVNAPAIMFPYFRSFISTLTVNCGGSLPPLTIPPRLFKGKLHIVTPEHS